MLLDTKIIKIKEISSGEEYKRYYMKAHELLMMMENASEVENAGSEHLRNVDIIRIRGFSQSLIQKILMMNMTL